MLKTKINERATLNDLINSDWLTQNQTNKINVEEVELDKKDTNGNKLGFGNISRLLKSKKLAKG